MAGDSKIFAQLSATMAETTILLSLLALTSKAREALQDDARAEAVDRQSSSRAGERYSDRGRDETGSS